MPELIFSDKPVAYPDAIAFMEQRVADIVADKAPECLWFLEHPPLYTAGTSANPDDLLQSDRFPVYEAKRGGEYTYHGPGQRVVYLMLDLRKRGRDVRRFVQQAENWVIQTLDDFNIHAHITEGRVGVWVPRPDKGDEREDKIAAIGLRIRRWVSFHGISINVEPELEHFGGIVPCGISDQSVTSMVDLGYPVSMEELDKALIENFEAAFTLPTQTQP
ncbi:lipoyl(octanoyl) transferase LipB [Alphaproteobacteria bacterium]|nr:lipoyl(octanoyl) transferase LipB [PS1 clade bacterium]MDA8544484.1 lipoyl(octanoyl) transferase LipB [Alphaproteobacteria bacterium]MDA8712554.1 lipoyl(octanoyl) transferase LipB [Alphaproteobacteria bacterium]MDB2393277.1 lipoyl(octanoyl) transferase LipB [Alphaproteobacteria bacterium]MDB2477166.1 lipoyl(octanoyl) transferase LipB [Alphaproteobacteria bacterium]